MDNISSVSKAATAQAASVIEAEKNEKGLKVNLDPESSNTFVSDTEITSPSLTVEEIDYAVEVINDTMSLINRSLNFRIDADNGRTVISIIDSETDEMIKQIPSEDLLKLINHMQEMQSLLAGEDV